jgi:hypothetical protein
VKGPVASSQRDPPPVQYTTGLLIEFPPHTLHTDQSCSRLVVNLTNPNTQSNRPVGHGKSGRLSRSNTSRHGVLEVLGAIRISGASAVLRISAASGTFFFALT